MKYNNLVICSNEGEDIILINDLKKMSDNDFRELLMKRFDDNEMGIINDMVFEGNVLEDNEYDDINGEMSFDEYVCGLSDYIELVLGDE